MTTEKDFFISVLRLVDDGLLCSIKTYDDNLINDLNQMKSPKIYSWANTIILDSDNKSFLIDYAMLYDHSIEQIYYFEIKRNDDIIFVAYDGFEIGIISSSIKLTEEFVDKFVKTNLCGVSDTIVPW